MKMGSWIVKALARDGQSQVWLADRLGVKQQTVNEWCKAESVRLPTMRKVNRVLRVPEFSLLLGEDAVLDVAGVQTTTRVVNRLASVDPDFEDEILALIRQYSEAPEPRREDLKRLLSAVRGLSGGHGQGRQTKR